MTPSPLPPCPSSLIGMMFIPSHERTNIKQPLGQHHDAQEAQTPLLVFCPGALCMLERAYTEHDYFI